MSRKSVYSIYRAKCMITNKSYIGFTNDFERRKIQHKSDSKSSNSKFYLAIRKHGWKSFEWSVVYQSYNREHTLKEMEPYFIEQYDSFNNGYNSTLGGESISPDIIFVKEYVVMYPNGKIESIENLNKFCRDKNLQVTGMRDVAIGNKKRYKGYQVRYKHDKKPFFLEEEIGQKKITSYKLRDPFGIIHYTENLKQFCIGKNINLGAMYQVLIGNRSHHKFWQIKHKDDDNEFCQNINNNRRKSNNGSRYIITDPHGIRYHTENLNEFCDNNKLTNQCMYNVANGKNKHHKGWQCSKI